MAAPHTAGVVALVLQQRSDATPAEVGQVILDASVSGILSSVGTGSPNRLLQSQIVLAAPAVKVATSDLPHATVGQPYSVTLQASGGEGTYSWSTTPLPAGLALSGDVISGTPSMDGAFPVTFTVSAGESTDSATLTLTVAPQPTAVEPASITVSTSGGRWLSGNASVGIRASDAPHPTMPGVSVSGSWQVNGQLQTAIVSATTNGSGDASFSSPTYRVNNGTLGFCVRSLSGAGIAAISYNPPRCEGTGVGSDPVEPPPSDDEPLTPPPSDDLAPTIDTFTITRSSSGPWSNVDVTWAVRDETALASLRLEGRAGNGGLLASEEINLSGQTANGSTRLRARSEIATVELILTDAAGNRTIATR
jgi:hypothetical protein